MQTTLGRLIVQAQRTQQLTRYAVALALEVTPVSVSKWLRAQGDNPVPWKHYAELAHALRLPIGHVLSAARKNHPKHVQDFERFVRSLHKVGLTGQPRRR